MRSLRRWSIGLAEGGSHADRGVRAEAAALKSKAGKDSTNSSVPPSQDPIAAKAKRSAATSQRSGRTEHRPQS